MFAGESLALAGAAASPVPKPSYAMHTLTVTATNLAGKADTGDIVFVMNVDNSARFGDFNESVSVPVHLVDRGVRAALALVLAGWPAFCAAEGPPGVIGLVSGLITGARDFCR
jgi:hypothetical protein